MSFRLAKPVRTILRVSNRYQKLALLHAAHFTRSEVCNGGFHQFFCNTTGVLAPEAIEGFAAIGLPQISATVGRATEMLGSPYPRDRPERQDRLGKLHRDIFATLDGELYDLMTSEAGGFQSAANLYVARIVRS